MKARSGKRTLLASVLLSSPGPIVVGLGLLVGRSSTQLADFIRRTAELAAIIISWTVFRVTNKDTETVDKKTKLERYANICVGAAMCISGAIMLLVSILSYGGEKGNVVPGLVIAILGVIVNTWFWFRYHKLNHAEPNAILAVQSKLYRAKSMVDICVTVALTAILISPDSTAAVILDVAGSVVVSLYLAITGVTTIIKKDAK